MIKHIPMVIFMLLASRAFPQTHTVWPPNATDSRQVITTMVWYAKSTNQVVHFTNEVGGVVVTTNEYLVEIQPTNTWAGIPDFGPAAGLTPTNVTLWGKDVRAYEAFFAAIQRGLIRDAGSANEEGYRIYRNERDNLLEFKAFLSDGLSVAEDDSWVDHTGGRYSGTWHTNIFDASDSGNSDNQLWGRGHVGWMNLIGAPTNYLSYTPYRQLDGRGAGKQSVITNEWTIWAPGEEGTVTQDVTDAWVNDVAITGVHGETITNTAENSEIQSGFTHLDYGWLHSTSAIALMQWETTDRVRTIGVHDWYGASGLTSSWSKAKEGADSDFKIIGSGGVGWNAHAFTVGEYFPSNTVDRRYKAWKFARTVTARIQHRNLTNLVHQVTTYLFSTTNTWYIAATETSTDALDYISDEYGVTSGIAWCSDPTAFTNTARGFATGTFGGKKNPVSVIEHSFEMWPYSE